MNLKKELTEVMLKNELCSIFVADDLEDGYTGFILGVTDDEILMLKIDQEGREDGYYLRKTDDIFYLWTDDRYIRRRKRLLKKNERRIHYSSGRKQLSDELLAYAMEHHELVYVSHFTDSTYSLGWVKYFSDEILVLEECLHTGETDGETWIRREFLDEIKMDSQELRIRQSLCTSKFPELEEDSGKTLFERFKKYEGQKQLFEFFTDDDTEDDYYCIGELEYAAENGILVYCIDCDGEYDGHMLIPLNRISFVFLNDRVLQKRNYIRQTDEARNLLPLKGQLLFEEFLQYAQKNSSLILAEINENISFCGYVLDWNEKQIHLAVVNLYGMDDGQIWIQKDQLKGLSLDTKSLNHIEAVRRK